MKTLILIFVLSLFCLKTYGQDRTISPEEKTDIVSILLDGALETALKGSVQSGAMGVSYNSEKTGWDANFIISIDDNAASLSGDNENIFGNSILIPTKGKATLNVDIHKRVIDKFGGRIKLNIGFGTWENSSEVNSSNNEEGQSVILIAIDMTGKFTWPILNKDDNNITLSCNFGIIGRHLGGDVANNYNDQFRKDLLGTTSTSFFGGKGDLNLQINGVTGFVELLLIKSLNDNSTVKGLTGLQGVFGVSYRGNLWKFIP